MDTHADLTPFIMKDTKPAEITDSGMAGDAYFPNDDLIQINAVIKYIDPIEREHTPISVFMDHIDHAIDVAGADHVGIGLDYGYTAPVDLEDISKLGNVTYELLKRGYDEATIRKVLGENTLRVMREVEAVAAR